MLTATIARNLARAMTRKVYDRFMDRVGGRLISGIADTSSDAPNAFYEPKRDLYRQMVEEESRTGVHREAPDR